MRLSMFVDHRFIIGINWKINIYRTVSTSVMSNRERSASVSVRNGIRLDFLTIRLVLVWTGLTRLVSDPSLLCVASLICCIRVDCSQSSQKGWLNAELFSSYFVTHLDDWMTCIVLSSLFRYLWESWEMENNRLYTL